MVVGYFLSRHAAVRLMGTIIIEFRGEKLVIQLFIFSNIIVSLSVSVVYITKYSTQISFPRAKKGHPFDRLTIGHKIM